MPQQESLTRLALIGLAVLTLIFGGLGFYFYSKVGSPEKEGSLMAERGVLLMDRGVETIVPEGSLLARLKEEKKAIEDLKAQIKQKVDEAAELDWKAKVADNDVERHRRTWGEFQKLRDMRKSYAEKFDEARSTVVDDLERGASGEFDAYTLQSLRSRKEKLDEECRQRRSKLQATIDELTKDLRKVRSRYTRDLDEKRKQRDRLQTQLAQAEEELKTATAREPVQVEREPDAIVISSSVETRQAVISTGEVHRVKKGMKFEVYQLRQGRQLARKGYLQVRKVDRETSICTILEREEKLPRCPACGFIAVYPEELFCPYCTGGKSGFQVQSLSAAPKIVEMGMDPDDPIVEGDRAYNPFFDPKERLYFALKGDPLSDRYSAETVLATVRWHGAVVEQEVSARTNFLLAGKWASDDIKRARELGVKILHYTDVLEFLRQ